MYRQLVAWVVGCSLAGAVANARADVNAAATVLPPSPQASAQQGFRADSLRSLNEQLKAWLLDVFQTQGKSVAIEAQGAWGLTKAWLPEVNVAIQEQIRTKDGWQVALSVLPADAMVAKPKAASVKFKVFELQPVWLAAAAIRKGDEASCSLLRQDKRLRRAPAETWQGDCAGLSGLRMRHALQPGDILMAKDIGPASAVQDQQETMVITRLGRVEIQAKGRALADAQIGQKVPVLMVGQGSVIQAVVTAPGTVQVIEGMQ